MGQSYTCLFCHIIFSTKDRMPQVTPDLQQRLYDYMGGIVKNRRGALLAAGGTPDHVHLLIRLHPQTAVADLVRFVKANSSKWVHQTFAGQIHFAWQTGYTAFSVSSSNVERVRGYIARQEAHHRRTTLQEELISFLRRHGVEFNERYLWA